LGKESVFDPGSPKKFRGINVKASRLMRGMPNKFKAHVMQDDY